VKFSDLIKAEVSRLKRGVLQNTMALPFTLKRCLKAKEKLWKLKYFTMQKHNLQKHRLKTKPKSLKILELYITNLKFISTQAKSVIFQKS
jgi:hypothetical protein